MENVLSLTKETKYTIKEIGSDFSCQMDDQTQWSESMKTRNLLALSGIINSSVSKFGKKCNIIKKRLFFLFKDSYCASVPDSDIIWGENYFSASTFNRDVYYLFFIEGKTNEQPVSQWTRKVFKSYNELINFIKTNNLK